MAATEEPSPWNSDPALSPESVYDEFEEHDAVRSPDAAGRSMSPVQLSSPPAFSPPAPAVAADAKLSLDGLPPLDTLELDDPPRVAAQPPHALAVEDAGFDDFDDFDEPTSAPAAGAGDGFGADDDFGDFGDFDEADAGGQGGEGFDEMDLEAPAPPAFVAAAPPAPSYPTLSLSPLPDASTLAALIHDILAPVFPDLARPPADLLTKEDLREVPGLGQVLPSAPSRELYESLTSLPQLTALDWTRSRVRREHLINLGVPVNLDEVASSKAPSLPPLRIITTTGPARPVSTPPVDRGTGGGGAGGPKRSNTLGGSSLAPRRAGPNQGVRSGSSTPRGPAGDVEMGARGRREKTYGLGKKPELDVDRAKGLLESGPDSLSLLSLPALESLHLALQQSTSEASAHLSYLLQLRDAQQNEALVSNGMIAELVASAQRAALPVDRAAFPPTADELQLPFANLKLSFQAQLDWYESLLAAPEREGEDRTPRSRDKASAVKERTAMDEIGRARSALDEEEAACKAAFLAALSAAQTDAHLVPPFLPFHRCASIVSSISPATDCTRARRISTVPSLAHGTAEENAHFAAGLKSASEVKRPALAVKDENKLGGGAGVEPLEGARNASALGKTSKWAVDSQSLPIGEALLALGTPRTRRLQSIGLPEATPPNSFVFRDRLKQPARVLSNLSPLKRSQLVRKEVIERPGVGRKVRMWEARRW